MSEIIVELGDGLDPLAESYIDIDYANTYFENRDAPEAWFCGNQDKQEAAIRYAMLYLETKYVFKGCLQSKEQPLSFPRTAFYDKEGRVLAGKDIIPEVIKQAVCELALRHMIEDLFYELPNQDKRIISESVGDRSVTLKGNAGNGSFKVVSNLLRPYLNGNSGVIPIVRG